MELKDLKETNVDISCDSKEAAQSIYNILSNALPNGEWNIIQDANGISRYALYRVVNNAHYGLAVRESMLQMSSDIFAKLFLETKEEVKEGTITTDAVDATGYLSKIVGAEEFRFDPNKGWQKVRDIINWEQRRYEIAKDILAANRNINLTGRDIEGYIYIADALIERLKKEEIC